MDEDRALLLAELDATRAELAEATTQYRDLHSAIYAAPCDAEWTKEEHEAAVQMIASIFADPNERWVDERNIGAEAVARMVLEGASGEGMCDGPIPQALARVRDLTARAEKAERELAEVAEAAIGIQAIQPEKSQ